MARCRASPVVARGRRSPSRYRAAWSPRLPTLALILRRSLCLDVHRAQVALAIVLALPDVHLVALAPTRLPPHVRQAMPLQRPSRNHVLHLDVVSACEHLSHITTEPYLLPCSVNTNAITEVDCVAPAARGAVSFRHLRARVTLLLFAAVPLGGGPSASAHPPSRPACGAKSPSAAPTYRRRP